MNGADLIPAELAGWINAPADRVRRELEGSSQQEVLQAWGRIACAKRAAHLVKVAKDAVPALDRAIHERTARLPDLQANIDQAQRAYDQTVKDRRKVEGSRGEAAAEKVEEAANTVLDRARVVKRINDNELASLRQAQRELERLSEVFASIPPADVGLLGDVLKAVPVPKSK